MTKQEIRVIAACCIGMLAVSIALRGARLASADRAATSATSRAVAQRADLLRFLPNDGNNVFPAPGLLRQWPAAGPHELWRAAIGEGKSAIAESQGRVYTLTQTEKRQYAVCLEASTGRILWKRLLLPKDNHHVVNGPVNAPLLDGDRLYVFPYDCRNGDFWYPRFPCICLRADDGRVVWREERAFHCSEGSTPLISGDVLYIGGCLRDNILAAVDKRTGKLLWKVGEERDAGSDKIFVCGSSLTYQVVDGIPQIVVAVFQNDLMGVHARTGRVLWHWKFSRATASGMIPTPVALGSQLFLSAFQGGVGYSQCLDMLASDGRITPRLRYEDKRLQCNMLHTPSIYQGAVFGFGKGPKHEALQCTNFSDGHLLWQKEGADWASDRQLTIADGLIFAITKRDELVLLEASRSGYVERGRVNPHVGLGLPQQPMIADGQLYLRGEDTLVCYRIAGPPR